MVRPVGAHAIWGMWFMLAGACSDDIVEEHCASCTTPADVSRVESLLAEAGSGEVSLTWDLPPSATAVMIRRVDDDSRASPSSGTEVYDGSATSFTDADVTNFQTYGYFAFAHDDGGNFAEVAATAEATPSFAALSALWTAAAPGEVTLSWEIPEGAAGILIRRDTEFLDSPTAGTTLPRLAQRWHTLGLG